MTAPIDTAYLRALLAESTALPWAAIDVPTLTFLHDTDSGLAAAAVNALSGLLDELDALRADLREYRNACEQKQEALDSTLALYTEARAENERRLQACHDYADKVERLEDAHLGQMQRANDLFVECERLRAELRIKSEFLSSRQCPDHNGKWPRGTCLQCEVERLRAALNHILNQTVGIPGGLAYVCKETARVALEGKS